MASEKNLNAVFTDIANAIREKKGTTDQIKPINMAEEIVNLPSGGGDIDWSEIGYSGTPQPIIDNFEYSKKIAREWNSSTTSVVKKYYQDRKLVFFPFVDTSNITNMSEMFYYCSSLISVPLIDTSKVTNMFSMFTGCSKLTTISPINTANVENMKSMFQNCSSLKTIPILILQRLPIFLLCFRLVTN